MEGLCRLPIHRRCIRFCFRHSTAGIPLHKLIAEHDSGMKARDVYITSTASLNQINHLGSIRIVKDLQRTRQQHLQKSII